jgi:hypothetical protein
LISLQNRFKPKSVVNRRQSFHQFIIELKKQYITENCFYFCLSLKSNQFLRSSFFNSLFFLLFVERKVLEQKETLTTVGGRRKLTALSGFTRIWTLISLSSCLLLKNLDPSLSITHTHYLSFSLSFPHTHTHTRTHTHTHTHTHTVTQMACKRKVISLKNKEV